MDVMPLEATLNSYFLISYNRVIPAWQMHELEVGATLAPLNMGHTIKYGNRSSKNTTNLVQKLFVPCRTTTWCLHDTIKKNI
jgi:hypothetical protein